MLFTGTCEVRSDSRPDEHWDVCPCHAQEIQRPFEPVPFPTESPTRTRHHWLGLMIYDPGSIFPAHETGIGRAREGSFDGHLSAGRDGIDRHRRVDGRGSADDTPGRFRPTFPSDELRQQPLGGTSNAGRFPDFFSGSL